MKFFLKVKDAFFNVFLYKCILLVFLIPTLLTPAVSFNYQLLFVMLGWGAVLCLHDLIAQRKFLRAPGMLWLLSFLVVFIAAVILNYRTNLSGNVAVFGYTVIALLLLYPDHCSGDKKRITAELFTLNSIFIGMTTILSTISFCMFACKFCKILYFDGRKFVVGWYQNRLYGMYKNMAYMTSAIGLALIAIQFTVIKARGGCKKWYKALLIYTAVVNFCSMCMENAKGAFISLAVFVAVFAFYSMLRAMIRRNRKWFVAVCTSLTVMLVSAAVLLGAVYTSRQILAYVPSIYSMVTYDPPATDPTQPNKPSDPSAPTDPTTPSAPNQGIVKEEVDREVPSNLGALTGRPKIWKYGIDQFKLKPLLGHGPSSHNGTKVLEAGITHFHNLIIQSLVSVGIVGSICIAIFFIRRILIAMIALWKRIGEDNVYIPVCIGLISLIGMFMVNSMSEVTVLFQARFSVFLFWMMLGYLSSLLDYEIRKEDKLMARVANWIDSKFKKAKKNEK